MSDAEQQVQRIAEDIVVGHARHRRRARWAVIAGAAIAVAAAVPLAIVLYRPVTDGRPIAISEPTTPRTMPTTSGYADRSSAADDARIYAAVLRDRQGTGTMRVYQRVCNSDGVCSAGAATAGLRQELAQRLGARMRFVAQLVGAIQLQAVHVHGDSASAQIEEDCGRMCLFGERVHLTRAGKDWRLTGEVEQWMS